MPQIKPITRAMIIKLLRRISISVFFFVLNIGIATNIIKISATKNADIFNEFSKKSINGPKIYIINFCLIFIFYSLFLELIDEPME